MSGFNLTGSSPTYDTTGEKFGTGALNGGSGLASAQIIAGFPFTMEGWVKRSGSPGALQVAFGESDVGFCGVSSSGYAQASAGTSGTQMVTTVAVCDGAWHHLALVVNSATSAAFYVDGAVAGTSSSCAVTSFSAYNFAVGTFGGLSGYAWTGETDEAVVWPTARYSANFTPPTAPYTGSEGMSALYHLDGNLNDSSASSLQTFSPNNANIYYSPGNWLASAASAETINPGAYLNTFFSGSTAPVLTFNIANDTGTLPQIYVVIDGQAAQLFTLASSIMPVMPSATSAWPRHSLKVVFKSLNDTSNAWSGRNASVVLTGIQLPAGTSLYPYTPAPLVGMALGDSITNGSFTLSGSGGSGSLAADSDGSLSAPYLLGAQLGAEMGVVGFGGQWISASGQNSDNGAPPLSLAYNLLWAGQNRTFPSNLNFIVVNTGTNDQVKGGTATGVQSGLVALLSGLLAVIPPTTQIIVMQPYDTAGQYPSFAAAYQAAVTAVGSSRVTYLSTAGWLDTSQTADGIHPLGELNMQFAAQIAATIKQLMTPVAGTGIHGTGARGGIR